MKTLLLRKVNYNKIVDPASLVPNLTKLSFFYQHEEDKREEEKNVIKEMMLIVNEETARKSPSVSYHGGGEEADRVEEDYNSTHSDKQLEDAPPSPLKKVLFYGKYF